MKLLSKALSFVGVAVAGSIMFAAPSFAATNVKAADHAPSMAQPAASQMPQGTKSGITPNGTSVPTMYWNLSNGNDYPANFSNVIGGVYTNYYFTSNNGSLYVKNISVNSSNATKVPYEIDLWDKTTGTELYYTSLTSNTDMSGQYIGYTGLNINDDYYIGVKSDNSTSISGQFTVSWTP